MTELRRAHVVEPLLLRAGEAAIVLGIGRTKVFEMLAAGELPAIRIGRCIRVPKDQLEMWIDQQTLSPANSVTVQRPLTPAETRLMFRSK